MGCEYGYRTPSVDQFLLEYESQEQLENLPYMVMRNKNNLTFLPILIALILAVVACGILSAEGGERSQEETNLFEGVTYSKLVYSSPRKMVVHILKVNVAKGTIRPVVTSPDDPDSDRPYRARTTSDFAQEYDVQIAINGGGFHPWYDYKLIYAPHEGDPVAPQGKTISDGFLYEPPSDKDFPMLVFGAKRPVDIGYIETGAKFAVSGTRMLVEEGQLVEGLNNIARAPRTAAGVDKAGHTLIIVVVDGRQAGYSKGATIEELAQILLDNGADNALELDGGGSSTLVLNKDGSPVVLNSPIHQGIPGRERPVATHIGFKIK